MISSANSPDAKSLNVGWLTDESDLLSARAKWNELAQSSQDDSLFLHFEWNWSAWRWLRSKASLAVLQVRRDDEIVGLLPLVREQTTVAGIGIERLRSLDIPDTQGTGLLCRPSDAPGVSMALAEALYYRPIGCDLLQLRKLRKTAPNEALVAALSRKLDAISGVADDGFRLMLNQEWRDYYSRRSRRLKKGNNLLENRLRRDFRNVEIVRCPIDASDTGDALLGELFNLAECSWKCALSTALHKRGPREWIESLRAELGGTGQLVAWLLRLDGEVVAAELQLDDGATVSALRADVREGLESYGPGTYLNWKVLESLMNSGRLMYDMGPGLNDYKARWAEVVERPMALDAYGRTMRGRYLHWRRVLGDQLFALRGGRRPDEASNSR